MKISRFFLHSILGLTSILSLSHAAASPDKEHAECSEHNHAEEKHEHKDSETCTEAHDHENEAKVHEHKHAEGEECSGESEHKHTEGEACSGESEHKHAEGEACSGEDEHNHDEANCPSAKAGGMVSITIDDKARHSLDMKVEKLVARPNLSGKSFYGQMEIPPTAVDTYALPAAGRVKLSVLSAQQVKKGDLLYTLDSPEILEMKAKADEDKAALNRNRIELDTLLSRQKQLEEIGTKNSELDTNIQFKQAERPGLEAAAENSSSKLAQALDGAELVNSTLHVKSDRDGSVQSIDMTRGAWGDQGATVLVLTNKGQLEFKANAYAADALDPASARLILESPDGRESIILDGKIRISDQINKDNQTRTIYFSPQQLPQWAYAGQVAKLEINSAADEQKGYIPVPNSAVVKVGIDDVVFIQDQDNLNKFIMQKVTILPPRQGMTPVKGVKEGQTIVVKGGYELKYAVPAQGGGEKKAAGHFHADGKFHEGEH